MLNGQCSDGRYPTVNTRMLNGRTTVDVTMTMDDGQRTTMDSRQPMDDNRPTTTTVGDRPTTTDQGQYSDAQHSTLGCSTANAQMLDSQRSDTQMLSS